MDIIKVLEILKNDENIKFEDEEENEISCKGGWLYYNNKFMNISLHENKKEGVWDYSNGPYTMKQVFETLYKNNDYAFKNEKGDRIYKHNDEIIITGSKGSSAKLSCDWYKESSD